MHRWWWAGLAACSGDERAVDPEPDPEIDPGVATVRFDDDRVLVVPDGDGLELVGNDGVSRFSRTWTELVGPCDLCGGEGASDDGDGLLLSFTTTGPTQGGAIARLDHAGALDFRVDGFGFPHDAERDPADGTIIVPEVSGSRVEWVAGDGSSAAAVRGLDSHEGWVGKMPNGAERFDHEGRSYLLLSHRGFKTLDGATGGITLWDISTPDAPALAWSFPSTGGLDTPHGAVFRWFEGRWWLLWAHTGGAPQGSSVGLAVTDDPTALPEYVADLVPVGENAPFDFLRGVELTYDGFLYLTDSGLGGGFAGASGRILVASMPTGLLPSGASGAVDEDQVQVDLLGAEVFVDLLANPFEGWLWTPTFPL